MRWNALAMVVQANRASSEYGGHIASYASAATLYEVGFNHFWRAKSAAHPGDMVYMQGHSSPGIYARAYLEGRLDEAQLLRFRQEVRRRRTVLLSASVAHAGFLAISDRVDGPGSDDGDFPGAVRALSRASRHRAGDGSQGLGVSRRRRDGRARVDGRAHHAGAREARQPHFRHQLQPAASRRSGARQRQDHPGARGGVSRRRLERHQGAVGIALGSAARARPQGTAQAPDGRVRRRRVPEFQVQGRRLHARAFLRQVSRAEGNGREHVRRGDLAPEPRRPRSAEGVCRLRRGGRQQGHADGDSREDREGLRPRQGRRGAERRAPAEEARTRRTSRPSATASTSRSPTRRSPASRSASRRPTARRCATCRSAAARSAAICRRATRRRRRWLCRRSRRSARCSRARGEREISTTMALVRILTTLVKDKNIGKHVVPIIPDEARTFGMEGMFRQIGIYSSVGPALHAAGRRSAHVLPRGQAGTDSRGGHQRGRAACAPGSPPRPPTRITA